MTSLVTATFKTRMAAETALQSVEAIGVTEEQISLVVTDETRGKSFNIKEGNKTDEGAAAGATAGGVIGVVLGSLATASAIAIASRPKPCPACSIDLSSALYTHDA